MSMKFVCRTLLCGMVLVSSSTWAAGAKVFVADEGSDTLTVIDAASFKKLATIPVGRGPHNVQLSPDGKRAWVTTNGERGSGAKDEHAGHGNAHEPASGQGQIWGIDTETHAVVAKHAVGLHPAHVVLTPNGRYAYVTNGGENTVSVIELPAGKLAATIPVGAYPHGVRISPDGREAYVANLKDGSVSIIDTASMKEAARLPVGKAPAQTGFTPDGRTAFVSLSGEDRVALIDPVARKVLRKVPVGTVPIQLYASLDGKQLFVANQGSRQRPGMTVSVIDIASGKVTKSVRAGRGAHGVVVGTDGRYAYVTNTFENTVSVIDVASLTVVSSVPTGKAPNGISLAP